MDICKFLLNHLICGLRVGCDFLRHNFSTFTYLVNVCAWPCHGAHLDVRGQSTEVSSPISIVWVPRIKLRKQGPLPREPLLHPAVTFTVLVFENLSSYGT